jgi:hypothetical protein
MLRLPGAEPGFVVRSALSASLRLTHAVAASVAVGTLSLCLVVMITVLATKASLALPLG